MAKNSPRPPGPQSAARKGRAAAREGPAETQGKGEEILERAARLGITPERILREYARIAFADLRRVAKWGRGGFSPKAPEDLSEEDAAAISEIVGSESGTYRVKLYDKKAALDAIARHLGLFGKAPAQGESPDSSTLAEDAREVLACRLARLASRSSEK